MIYERLLEKYSNVLKPGRTDPKELEESLDREQRIHHKMLELVSMLDVSDQIRITGEFLYEDADGFTDLHSETLDLPITLTEELLLLMIDQLQDAQYKVFRTLESEYNRRLSNIRGVDTSE